MKFRNKAQQPYITVNPANDHMLHEKAAVTQLNQITCGAESDLENKKYK